MLLRLKIQRRIKVRIFHSKAKDGRPYDIKSIKNLQLEQKIDKLIDVVDYIQNKCFYASDAEYMRGLQEILNCIV